MKRQLNWSLDCRDTWFLLCGILLRADTLFRRISLVWHATSTLDFFQNTWLSQQLAPALGRSRWKVGREKADDQLGNHRPILFERKVPGLQQMNLAVWHIVLEGLCPGRSKEAQCYVTC